MAPEAIEEMCDCLTVAGNFANPASFQHSFGELANIQVEQSRSEIANVLHCNPRDLVFTSGATEADNLAIKGIALAHQNQGNHIVSAASEHKAVLDTCRYLETQGFQVTYLRPGINGRIELDNILAALTEKTVLVSLMHVNNETGVIQDIEKIAFALNQKNILFHVDAAQSVGKLPIDLTETPIDLLSISGHKIYGPKGIGCLFVRNRKKTNLLPLFHGGGQEYGLRPGTLPTHQIAGLASAIKMAQAFMERDFQHAAKLQQLLKDQLSLLPDIYFNGDQDNKLPSIINVSFENVSSDSLIIALRDEIAIASGSACNSGAVEASHVLRSMGIEGNRLYGAIRISLGRYTTADEIKHAGLRICEEVNRLRTLALE